MTEIEIIDETVEYYKTHKRAYNENSKLCAYINPHGDMCAIGRCLLPDKAQFLVDISIALVHDLTIEELDPILEPKYRGKSMKFWVQLQNLHDDTSFWEPNELGGSDLSPSGEDNVRIMKETLWS